MPIVLQVLWAVQTLDRKWLLLQKRKSALHLYYNKRFEEEARRIDNETRLTLNQQLFKSVTEALKDAKSEREVDDVNAKFNFHFPPGEVETEDGQFKRPKRKSLYSICHKAGLWEVTKKFGANSEQFGSLLSLEKVASILFLEFLLILFCPRNQRWYFHYYVFWWTGHPSYAW